MTQSEPRGERDGPAEVRAEEGPGAAASDREAARRALRMRGRLLLLGALVGLVYLVSRCFPT